MKKFAKNNLIFLLPILSGVLLILAYPPYDLGFLVWIALIPLFWFIFLKQVSPKKALIGGSITGILFFGKLFSWLFATYPFEWIGAATKENIALVFILLIILYTIQTVFLGLFIGIFVWLLKLSFDRLSKFNFLILVPALWIVLEYLRAWGFGILYLGKESLLGPHWTLGNLAYMLHNKLALIQIADITGIYGISFLIVFVNVALFLILKKRNRTILAVLILVALVWTGYGVYKSKVEKSQPKADPPRVEIALLQTNFLSGSEFNPYQKKEVFDAVMDLFQTPEKVDIIIAPEGFGIVSLTGDKEIAKYLLKDFYKPGQIYLENQKVLEKKSRLFFYDLDKGSLGYHDKLLLIPNGDYLPYLTKALLSIYSFNIKYGEKLYNKGDKVKPVQNIGATICSSIISPNIQRKITKNGAEFLVVVSSDAPFHGSKALLAQNLAMSKLRAVENRRYFAQATNMGYSFLLDPKGKIVVKSNELGNKILFADVQFLNKKTIYTKLGDWPIFLSTIILLLTMILCYNKKRNSL